MLVVCKWRSTSTSSRPLQHFVEACCAMHALFLPRISGEWVPVGWLGPIAALHAVKTTLYPSLYSIPERQASSW